MSDENSSFISDIFGFGKTSDVVVTQIGETGRLVLRKIANAIGVAHEPTRIERAGKARVNVEVYERRMIAAVEDEIALQRILSREKREYENKAAITRRALAEVDMEKVQPEKLSDDWLSNFYDAGKNITEEEMRFYYSKVLAGEINTPGSFSRVTINIMRGIDSSYAKMFADLCSFSCMTPFRPNQPIVFDVTNSIFISNGVHHGALKQLDAIGLASYKGDSMNFRPILSKLGYGHLEFKLSYFDEEKELVISDAIPPINLGGISLTQAGDELQKIVKTNKVEGYFPALLSWFAKQGISAKG